MKSEEFWRLRKELDSLCVDLLRSKGADYTDGTDDRLSNFNKRASELGIPARVVWWTYFSKHLDAILKWVRDGEVQSEPLIDRFADARNYIDLGNAIYREEQEIP